MKVLDYEETGKALQKRIQDKGLMQKELASQIGVTEQTVHHWCHGLRFPNSDLLCSLADALECKVDDLLVRKVI